MEEKKKRSDWDVSYVVKVFLVLLFVLVILLFLLPMIHRKQRPKISPILGDMRSIHTALESYRLDFGTYPLPELLQQTTGDPELLAAFGGEDIPGVPRMLTTPVMYIKMLFDDPMVATEKFRLYANGYFFTTVMQSSGTTFGYFHDSEHGTILFSPGRDRDYDIRDPQKFIQDYFAGSGAAANLRYDPTNGANSSGDIIRIWNEYY